MHVPFCWRSNLQLIVEHGLDYSHRSQPIFEQSNKVAIQLRAGSINTGSNRLPFYQRACTFTCVPRRVPNTERSHYSERFVFSHEESTFTKLPRSVTAVPVCPEVSSFTRNLYPLEEEPSYCLASRVQPFILKLDSIQRDVVTIRSEWIQWAPSTCREKRNICGFFRCNRRSNRFCQEKINTLVSLSLIIS